MASQNDDDHNDGIDRYDNTTNVVTSSSTSSSSASLPLSVSSAASSSAASSSVTVSAVSSSTVSSSVGILRLFVGTTRIPEVLWDLFTVREFVTLRCLSKKFRNLLEHNFEYLYCRDGNEYVVPYPGYPGLLQHHEGGRNSGNNNNKNNKNNEGNEKENKNNDVVDDDVAVAVDVDVDDSVPTHLNANKYNKAGLYPHQLASLRAMYEMENRQRHFGTLRGGVLGDAPGLGKTITSLAIIASTAGQRPVSPPEFWDTTNIQEGWKYFRINPEARTEINKCLRPIRHLLHTQELHYVTPPFNNEGVTSMLDDDDTGENNNHHTRFPTLQSYKEYLYRLVRKGQGRYQQSSSSRGVPLATASIWELVRQNLLELQMGMDKRNRKLLMSPQGQRLLIERRLMPTSATLLVVPDALFEHWFQQIRQHLYLPIFADSDNDDNNDNEQQEKLDDKNNTSNGINDDSSSSSSSSSSSNKIKNIARGVVYLDGLGDLADVARGDKVLDNSAMKKPVVSSDQLSGYLIVIVTFSRCKKEIRDGHGAAGVGSENQKRKRSMKYDSNEFTRSPLLQLRWLRLMIDEGHQLETEDGLVEFINEVAAERRWVISGTPLVGNEDHPKYNTEALHQLQRIMYFLRHPRYGFSTSTPDVKKAWDKEVKTPFLTQQSRDHILRVLKDIMVMHRKEDLKLPAPIFRQIEREVDIPVEVESTIIAQSSSLEFGLHNYLYSPPFQSLVDNEMAKYITETMQTARRTQRQVGNHRQQQTNKCDRRPVKGVVYSSSNKDLLSVSDSILRNLGFVHEHVAELYENSSIGEMSSELERFRHGISTYRTCPVCKRDNGMLLSKCDNDLMEVVSTVSGERFLIEPERVLTTINVPFARLNGELLTNYIKSRKFWRVGDKLRIDIRDPHPLLPKRKSEEVWKDYGSDHCKQRALQHQYQSRDWYFGALPRSHTNDDDDDDDDDDEEEQSRTMEVVLVKWQKCGSFHNSGWYQGPKFVDAPPAKREEDTFLLCLDANLAHGLDLSFVPRIFLLEPIIDAALLEQVTSRAHRLGATGPVTVDTIHVFYKCSESFQQKMLLQSSSSSNRQKKRSSNNSKRMKKLHSSIYNNLHREESLKKIVCHHCYRQFASYELAEEHERKLCKRNPSNMVTIDPYHLSSVYKEIRPPLPMLSSSLSSSSSSSSSQFSSSSD